MYYITSVLNFTISKSVSNAPRVQYACIQLRDKHMVLYTYDKLICPQLIYPFLAYFVEKQN